MKDSTVHIDRDYYLNYDNYIEIPFLTIYIRQVRDKNYR